MDRRRGNTLGAERSNTSASEQRKFNELSDKLNRRIAEVQRSMSRTKGLLPIRRGLEVAGEEAGKRMSQMIRDHSDKETVSGGKLDERGIPYS